MKSIWHGTISFGLVSIPINLFSAINPHVYGFKMLHAQCHHLLSYERWCSHCKKKVTWQDTVKGLELDNKKFFIATQQELAQLKPEKSDTINIIQFSSKECIKPLYIENHFYMAPKKAGDKSFFLFQRALADSDKVAIGQFVMREKEYACAITPYETTLILNTLNYAYEIRDIQEIKELHPIATIDKAELKLAKELIAQLTKKTFNLAAFKDTFAERLKKAIATQKTKKLTGKKAGLTNKKPPKEKTNLVEMLKASLKKPRSKQSIHSSKAIHAKKK